MGVLSISYEFESSVNSEGIEAKLQSIWGKNRFESSVNSEGIEAPYTADKLYECLRAV